MTINNLRRWCTPDNTPDNQSGTAGSNPARRITLHPINNPTDKFHFDQIIKHYHTYKPTTELLGRQLNYLIQDHNRIIGAIGLGSSVMAMKPRDDYIGWNKEQRLRNLTKTATNWRYCLMEKGTNLTSQVLKQLHRTAPHDWKEKYGQPLVLLETLVEPPYTGKSYISAGWTRVGQTKGMNFEWKHKSKILPTDTITQKHMEINGQRDEDIWKVVTGKTTKKIILIKPLHRYWKKELTR